MIATTLARRALVVRIRRYLLILAIVFILGYFSSELIYLFLGSEWRHLYDLGFFYYVFHVVWTHQPSGLIYNIHAEQVWMKHYLSGQPLLAHDEYLYPPQFAFLWSWLGAFSVRQVTILWMTFSILSYFASFYLLLKIFFGKLSIGPVVIFLALMAFFEPYLSDIVNGNSDWLILFFLVLTFYLHVQKHEVATGITLGLATVLKMTPVLLVIYFLWRREWKASITSIATMLLITGATVAQLGLAPMLTFISSFTHMSSAVLIGRPAPWNSSLRGVLELRVPTIGYLATSQMNFVFDVYLVAILAAGAWMLLRGNLDPKMEFSLVVLYMLLVSPVVEAHHMLMSLIPIFAVWTTWLKSRSQRNITSYVLGCLNLLMVVCILATPEVVISKVFHPLKQFMLPLSPVSYFLILMLLVSAYVSIVLIDIRLAGTELKNPRDILLPVEVK